MKITPIAAASLAISILLSACSQSASPNAGVYRYEGRDRTMGDVLTRAEMDLNPDGTASVFIQSQGYLSGVGTTRIETQLSGEGKWKGSGESIEVTISIRKWLDNGKSQSPTELLKMTVRTGAVPAVSMPRIRSEDGSSFMPNLSPLFGVWTHEPTP